MTLGGVGSGLPVWVEVLTSVLGVPALRHRSGEAASAGAALLAGKAIGMGLTLDQLDPVEAVIEPDAAAVEVYLGLRSLVDHVAEAVLTATDSIPGAEHSPVLTGARPRSPTAGTGHLSRCPTVRRSWCPWTSRASTTRRRPSPTRSGTRWPGRLSLDCCGAPGRVAVVFPDLTRPMPNRTVLPPLLAELARAGVPEDRITLLCATGTHRQASAAEMEELVGGDIVARYTVVDHDATSDGHVLVGEVDGTPMLLQREYVEADVRILTGFVEPHFFAGFSGGPKGVCPGLAATETILEAHHPRRIADARATFVTRAGNPVHDFVRAATALAPPDLSLDVAINRARRVTAVFAGPLPDAHDAACAHVSRRRCAGRRAFRSRRLDQRRVPARPQPLPGRQGHGRGGTDRPRRRDRRDGRRVRGRGAGRRRVRRASSMAPRRRPSSPGLPGAPSWTAGRPRCWVGCCSRAEVHVHSAGLEPSEIEGALLVPAPDLDAAVAESLGRLGPGRGWP